MRHASVSSVWFVLCRCVARLVFFFLKVIVRNSILTKIRIDLKSQPQDRNSAVKVCLSAVLACEPGTFDAHEKQFSGFQRRREQASDGTVNHKRLQDKTKTNSATFLSASSTQSVSLCFSSQPIRKHGRRTFVSSHLAFMLLKITVPGFSRTNPRSKQHQ